MSESRITLQVDVGLSRMRLEEYLFAQFGELSRMYLRDVIRSGKCEVNGSVENKGKRVRTGDLIEIELDEGRAGAMRPESIPLEIVFEDEALLVVNKAPGQLVHPTHREKSGTLLNGLSFYLNSEEGKQSIRPGLVHRLDKETSGLMVVAKTLDAHRILARQFQRRTVKKLYLAMVEGTIKEPFGEIDAPIGRFSDEKRWDVKLNAKQSLTRFRVLERFSGTTLLELEPITGRTNQLRIHCAAMGHPIVGDEKRGGRKFGRLCLHAYSLSFNHPQTGQTKQFSLRTEFNIC